jgi:hypothetical protein
MQPSSGTPDPVKRPTVKLGGQEYEVKFRLSDLAWLNKEHKIDLASNEPVEVKGFAALERIALILTAGIAHVASMTPEEVMGHIDVSEMAVYTLAVVEAQKKVSPEAVMAQKELDKLPKRPPKPKPDASVQ